LSPIMYKENWLISVKDAITDTTKTSIADQACKTSAAKKSFFCLWSVNGISHKQNSASKNKIGVAKA